MLPPGGAGATYMATRPNPFPDIPRRPPDEEARIDAAWREGITLASRAWIAARRCWNCKERWTPAGECPTAGCRGPGSGYITRAIPREAPCVSCQALTRDWYVGGLLAADRFADGEVCPVEWVVGCPQCEAQRNRAQAEAVASNPNVYPHIRERMVAYLALAEVGPD